MLIRLCVLFSLLSFIIIYVLSDAPRHFKVKGNGRVCVCTYLWCKLAPCQESQGSLVNSLKVSQSFWWS